MITNKIILIPSSIENLEIYKENGIENYLFPLDKFSIGFKTFSLEDVKNTRVCAFLLINRLLSDEDIDEFLQLEIPENVKGFIIEDIGLYYALKDKNYELINFQNHLNNSSLTVNYWLEYFNSLVLSTDITLEEMKNIIDTSSKRVCLNIFGYIMIMYSRRNLVSNYFKYKNKKIEKNIEVSIPNNDLKLKFIENDYGTAVFDNEIYDIRAYLDEFDDEKIKFYIINTNFIDDEVILNVLQRKKVPNTKEGFLNKKTIYKIGDLK